MSYLAVVTPIALMLLALLLGRLERWLDRSTPPPPPPAERHRWRAALHRGRRAPAVQGRPVRGLRGRRTRAVGRQAALPPTAVAVVPRSDRRQRLRARLRPGR
jgi:hypothetical protein